METVETQDGPAPDDTPWKVLREDYLAGSPARVLCESYGVPLSTFRARARREGWRHCDQPDASATRPPPPDDEPFDADLLVIRARAHLRRAVIAGDALGALRWMKMVDQLTDFARRERCVRVRHAPDANRAEDEAREAAWRRREAAEAGPPDLTADDDRTLDPDPDLDSPPSPESNAYRAESSAQPADRLRQSEALCDELDSLDSFFSAADLAAHQDLADAVRAMSALSPFLREQAHRRAGGP
ncbi:hypothetical protein [Brevundimonas lutea]|uniref:hypothetical protein n=1 Tax=Brevundimonas lutea TaxID=2293980 RepID=UPI000F02D639|nr:hypothetical protein [Brevundimonas lutea]